MMFINDAGWVCVACVCWVCGLCVLGVCGLRAFSPHSKYKSQLIDFIGVFFTFELDLGKRFIFCTLIFVDYYYYYYY